MLTIDGGRAISDCVQVARDWFTFVVWDVFIPPDFYACATWRMLPCLSAASLFRCELFARVLSVLK